MNLIDKVLLEWSYKTKKGYPDINSQEDMDLFESIFGFNLNEAYTDFPTSIDQISNPKIQELFKIVKAFRGLKINGPIALDLNKKNSPKITRSF
jgi:hypothetical protein